jgi:sensor domain CHASE-containing protein
MPSPFDHTPGAGWSRPRVAVAVLGGFCLGLGTMVAAGWIVHLAPLIQVRPTFAPMQFNTAICFILIGAALGLWGGDSGGWIVPTVSGVVAAIGGLTLEEYLFQANLGIDQLLFHDYITTETPFPGRMSAMSSLCILLLGLALLLAAWRTAPRWGPVAAGALGSIVIGISLVTLLGYSLGLPGTWGWTQFTRVPVYSAACFSLAGAAVFIIAWSMGLQAGESAPRWLPVPLALAAFTGSLLLYFALEAKQDKDVFETVRADADGTGNQIAVRMESRARSLARMARDWEVSGPPTQAAWEASATSYVHDIPDVEALEWIDAMRHVRWMTPVAGSGRQFDDRAMDERREAALEQAQREQQPVVSRIVSLPDGSPGFVIYAPIIVDGQSDGFLAGLFKAETCLQRYLPSAVAAGEAITVSDGAQIFYKRDAEAPPRRADWIVDEPIDLHGATWNLRMWPAPELATRLDSSLPGVVLCAGLLGGLLLGAVMFYAQRSSREAVEIRRANAALQAALDTVKTLEGLLPICSYCKRVRDDSGYWSQIDTYLRKHTNASLTHGYCPECAAKFYEECGIDVPDNVKAELEAHNYE